MVGYPYSYGDNLSEEEAISNFISLLGKSKYVAVGFCFTLAYAKSASAFDVAAPKGNATVAEVSNDSSAAPGKGVSSFAPIVAIGLGASPQVRTALLIGATGAVCYLAFTGDDKSLYVACGLLASRVGEIFKSS